MSRKLSSLSVFFPCYNEEANIAHFVSEAMSFLPTIANKFEIIIVNDGSSDQTQAVAEKFSKKFPQVVLVSHPTNLGYGASIKTGIDSAKYDWVFFTDGDLQFSLSDLAQFVEHTDRYQVIIGYRKNRADGMLRSTNANLYKLFIDALFRLGVKDIDCAFKLFKSDLVKSIHLESQGAFTSAELLYKLKKHKVAFKQIGVNHFQRKFGSPTGNSFRVILRACFESFKLYLRIKFFPNSQSHLKPSL